MDTKQRKRAKQKAKENRMHRNAVRKKAYRIPNIPSEVTQKKWHGA